MNSEKKKKKRSWISATCIVLAGVLLVGSLAALLPRTTSDSLNQNSIIIERPVDLPKDVLTRAEVLEAVASKAAVKPENGNVINYVSFSEVVSSDKSQISNIPGFVGESYIRYGNISTLDHYLEFTTPDNDSNAGMDSSFRFSVKENGHALSLEYVDYVTVDFDLWTNTDYVNEIAFYFVDSERNIDANPRLLLKNNYQGSTYPVLKSSTDYAFVEDLFEPTKPIHITFVCKIQGGQYEPATSETLVYLDGKLLTSGVNNFTHYNLSSFELYFRASGKSQQGVSVCMDNFQVTTFGDGSENYTGALSDLYNDHSLTLDNCADSVLYKK